MLHAFVYKINFDFINVLKMLKTQYFEDLESVLPKDLIWSSCKIQIRCSRFGASTQIQTSFSQTNLLLLLWLKQQRLFLSSFKRYYQGHNFFIIIIFWCGSPVLDFSCLGLSKFQLPPGCPFISNARPPRAIRSNVDSLLQAGCQICALRTMIRKENGWDLPAIRFEPLASGVYSGA